MTCVSSYLGLVSWMCLHLRVDVHPGTRTQYRSLQTPSSYLLSYFITLISRFELQFFCLLH
ncbi:unnamed protein product [Schistosoma mattheei]|uniref:Uncharacterized protein n=1 Tax=Schistosoma mattheei TaxID=31246 RepID=A0A3P8HQT6_9TREM|nr:unnamed protein product [Schistosoma mattheei]